MEREHWVELSQLVSEVSREFPKTSHATYPTATIVRVQLWAIGHNESVSWACKPCHWDYRVKPVELPDQSTMSRRTKTPEFRRFLEALGQRLTGPRAWGLIHKIDGKPLNVAAHSRDPDARWGHGAGGQAKGYKLHAIWGPSPMPEQWRVTPLNADEKKMARRMLRDLPASGYLLADGNYDSNRLYDQAAQSGYQLLAPRTKPGSALGHVYQSSHRQRAIILLESRAFGLGQFGPALYAMRRQIERDFGNACSFSGGMLMLPPFVRRLQRVRIWIFGKLLFNAARIRCLRRRKKLRAA